MIRPARQTDAGRVGAILSGFIDGTDWMPRIHTRAEDLAHAGSMIDRGWVQVAERDGAVQGFLAREQTWVHALYIDAAAQRQGLGRALLGAAMTAQDELRLWTFEANHAAQKFYASQGFTEQTRTNGSGNDEGLPDIQYLWRRS